MIHHKDETQLFHIMTGAIVNMNKYGLVLKADRVKKKKPTHCLGQTDKDT